VGAAVAVISSANAVTPFTAADMAVLVPTFNRPQKLDALLASIAGQASRVGRVIIVDGGTAQSAREVAEKYAGQLTVDYFVCQPPGQLRQRNFGLDQLAGTDRLVALLDDDIVLLAGAIEAMIRFWNAASDAPAAVSFNIVNGEPERFSRLRAVFGLTAREPGRVLRSGMTTALSHLTTDTRVQWVPGGATVWRKEILLERRHPDIRARWAIAEDLMFSYGIGKTSPLYLCAAAQCRHEHVSDYGASRQEHYHGRTQTLWWYYFVASQPDLSRAGFFWTLFVRMFGRFVRGVVRADRGSFEFAAGQLSAAGSIFWRSLLGRDLRQLLDDPH
jgi:glycosyltransferase involved in cell wall biosynthesis